MKILLDDYMRKNKLSIGKVSVMTGLSKSTIYEIKNGSMPQVDTLELLAKGLHIRIRDLIDSPFW
nr:MAG TPA: helix-turn-helix domain protein [Caudoviricetes sp.]